MVFQVRFSLDCSITRLLFFWWHEKLFLIIKYLTQFIMQYLCFQNKHVFTQHLKLSFVFSSGWFPLIRSDVISLFAINFMETKALEFLGPGRSILNICSRRNAGFCSDCGERASRDRRSSNSNSDLFETYLVRRTNTTTFSNQEGPYECTCVLSIYALRSTSLLRHSALSVCSRAHASGDVPRRM